MSEQAEHVEEQEGPTPEERLEWRMNALRLVRQFPDPALRNSASPIDEVDDEVQQLAGRMVDIMERAHGVGLAAPQIGVLRRILVYRSRDEEQAHVLINPQLVDRSEETEVGTEGCLSLLGGELQVPVERSLRLVLTGLDDAGDPLRVEVEGIEARVLQHEVDHLDGILIIDRAAKEDRRAAMRELRLRA